MCMYTFCHRSTYCKCSNNINVLSTSEELEGNIGQSTNRQRHFIIHLCKIRIFQYFCGRISCTYLDYNYFRLFTKTRRLKLRHLQYFIENTKIRAHSANRFSQRSFRGLVQNWRYCYLFQMAVELSLNLGRHQCYQIKIAKCL